MNIIMRVFIIINLIYPFQAIGQIDYDFSLKAEQVGEYTCLKMKIKNNEDFPILITNVGKRKSVIDWNCEIIDLAKIEDCIKISGTGGRQHFFELKSKEKVKFEVKIKNDMVRTFLLRLKNIDGSKEKKLKISLPLVQEF